MMESAAKPNYSRDSWTIQSVLGSSWEKQKGAKGIILLACLIYMVITTIVELSYGALLISLDVIEYGDQWDNVTWSVQLVGSVACQGSHIWLLGCFAGIISLLFCFLFVFAPSCISDY